jgi:hypothetical protein
VSAACTMSAACLVETPGCRETLLARCDLDAFPPALPTVFVLLGRVPPNRWRGKSSRDPVREFRPPISSDCPAFVPPQEGPSDRGHSTTKTFTHGEELT